MEITNIKQNAKNHGIPIIRTESHRYLQEIVTKYQPVKILEIGTAVGYSAIAMLNCCKASIITIEHNKSFIKQAKENLKENKLYNRVKIINGDCLVEIAKMVASKKYDDYFDLIFLDGPKAQYNSMLESLIYLLKPNGIFLADNVLFRGYVENSVNPPTKRYKTIIKRLNEFIENCKNHPKLINFKLNNIEDGLIFAQKVIYEK